MLTSGALEEGVACLLEFHPCKNLGLRVFDAEFQDRYIYVLDCKLPDGPVPVARYGADELLGGLRAEGAEAPLVLWALCRELRSIADVRNGVTSKAWGAAQERRQALVGRAARRPAGEPIERWFEAAAHIDRQVKGQAKGGGDPWTSLAGLVAAMSGARLPPAMLRG